MADLFAILLYKGRGEEYRPRISRDGPTHLVGGAETFDVNS